jgi:hypothetical protein
MQVYYAYTHSFPNTYCVPTMFSCCGFGNDPVVFPALVNLRGSRPLPFIKFFLYARHCVRSFASFTYVIITKCFLYVIISILEMRRLRYSEIRKLAQNHKASKW